MQNKPDINVLVMAVGSPLGQSIAKALIDCGLPTKIHVADISNMAAGFYFENVQSVVFPLIKAEDYMSRLVEYLTAHKISVVFPTIAAEHEFFAKHAEYFQMNGVHIVSCAPETFQMCNDKFISMHLLKKAGLNAPDTALCEELKPFNSFLARNSFPMVLKPRFGASSNDVYIVKDMARLNSLIGGFAPDYFIVQEFLSDLSDYTVGVFSDSRAKRRNTFIVSRNLKFGLSYSGTVIENPTIKTYCCKVAEAVGATFSVNVQLKLVEGKPCAYEINPRLSSTTSVRAHFGFNEPEFILREIFDLPPSPKAIARSGRFMRYWQEIYLDEV